MFFSSNLILVDGQLLGILDLDQNYTHILILQIGKPTNWKANIHDAPHNDNKGKNGEQILQPVAFCMYNLINTHNHYDYIIFYAYDVS